MSLDTVKLNTPVPLRHVAEAQQRGQTGLATPPDADTIEALIERADHALYDAKADGRGQIRWFGRHGPANSRVTAER